MGSVRIQSNEWGAKAAINQASWKLMALSSINRSKLNLFGYYIKK